LGARLSELFRIMSTMTPQRACTVKAEIVRLIERDVTIDLILTESLPLWERREGSLRTSPRVKQLLVTMLAFRDRLDLFGLNFEDLKFDTLVTDMWHFTMEKDLTRRSLHNRAESILSADIQTLVQLQDRYVWGPDRPTGAGV